MKISLFKVFHLKERKFWFSILLLFLGLKQENVIFLMKETYKCFLTTLKTIANLTVSGKRLLRFFFIANMLKYYPSAIDFFYYTKEYNIRTFFLSDGLCQFNNVNWFHKFNSIDWKNLFFLWKSFEEGNFDKKMFATKFLF